MTGEFNGLTATVPKRIERSLQQLPASQSAPVRKLQAAVARALEGRAGLRVLEAGCGSSTHIDLGAASYVAGIDISAQQLARNAVLDQKILGDLETYELPDSDFDVIICWDVLEHLSHPEKALRNFVRTAKDDALIILAVPNLWSVKGLITKLTPYPVHVWAWRLLFKVKNAGRDDNGPFR